MKTINADQVKFTKIWGELCRCWVAMGKLNARRKQVNTLMARCRISAEVGLRRLAILDNQISALQSRDKMLSRKLAQNPVTIRLKAKIATTRAA